MSEECEHDWSLSPALLMSNPPQQDMICRKCRLRKRISCGSIGINDYDEIVKKLEEEK